MTHCIALTGRAGCGKSTVAALFLSLGAPIIDADEINHALLQPGMPAYQAIRQHFGDQILLPNQHIHKRLLRQWMIQDPAVKIWLESLLHPLIRAKIQQTIQTLKKFPYCILEIPLPIDKKNYPYVERILFVNCAPDLQLKRLMTREQLTQQEAQALIDLQAPAVVYRAQADDVLNNEGSLDELKQAVKHLHEKYLLI